MNPNSLLDNVEFINAINIASFILAIQNLGLNVTSTDLDRYSKLILEEIHGHLAKQDNHLEDQDKRLDRLEKTVLGMLALRDRKEN